MFRITCGDKFVSSLEKGEVLIMTLNLKFSSSEEKYSFETYQSSSDKVEDLDGRLARIERSAR